MLIIDDFIKDSDLLVALNEETEKKSLPYSWADYEFSADSSVLQLVHEIWRSQSMLRFDISHIAGFEYWSGIYEAGDRKEKKAEDGNFYHLYKHFDKDEALWARTGEVSCPLVGTIFYPSPENDYMEGGELCIWYTKDSDIVKKAEILQPKFNRLVIFDPSNLHAVRMVTKGKRKAIAINLWETKPETFYERF